MAVFAATTTDRMSIAEAARRVQATPSLLRIWETRYGWPTAHRTRGGLRYYTVEQVDYIAKVLRYLRSSGLSPREVIRDGMPQLPAEQRDTDPVPAFDASEIPEPASTEALAVRRQLLAGLLQRHSGVVRAAVAQCARLHPRDRSPAVLQVIAAYRAQIADHAWLDLALES